MPVLNTLAASYDAVVIGCGPVGALAANLLGQEGLATLIVDAAPEVYDRPRAIGLDHESLRILQSVGVAARLESELGPYRTSEYRSVSGQVLRRILPQPEPHLMGWPPYATFVQPRLEALLREQIARAPTLTLRTGTRGTVLSSSEPAVRLRLEGVDTGEIRDIAARYVLACDGASSATRDQLGLTLEDLDFDQSWLVVDVLVDQPALLPEVNVQSCNVARPSTYVRGPGNLRRWEFMLLPDEDPDAMATEQVVWRLLSPWLEPAQGRLWRTAAYRFHALVADQWRSGNVFLLGDAAHQMPPFMAQGLNQGMRDAGNLCWKLGEVSQARAAAALLDTYARERRPVVRAVTERSKSLGNIICERDSSKARLRDRLMLSEMADGRGNLVRQDLLPPLMDGLLLRDSRGRILPGAGHMFPQPWVATAHGRQRLDDHMRARLLLVGGSDWSPSTEIRQLAGSMGVTLMKVGPGIAAGVVTVHEEQGLIATWLDSISGRAALIRPDHVVYGVVSDEVSEILLLNALSRDLWCRRKR